MAYNRLLSNKQLSYICFIVERDLPELFSRIPKNNAIYTKDADYRRMILADKLSNFTMDDAQTVIDLIEKKDEQGVEQMIFGLLGINN